MASARVVDRTRRAVSEVLRRQGYVSAVDVFLEMGTLKQQDLEDWRFGRVPFLERKLIGGLGKLSTTLREMKRLCGELGLKPSQTAYMKWGKGPKRPLRFSKSGKPHVEETYRTHWVSQRVAKQDSRGRSRAAAIPNQARSRGEPAASGSEPPGHPPLPALERDPTRVEQLAERRWEENVRLRSFLKSGHLSDRDVDRGFRRLYEWVRTEIDCTACANCCKTLPIVVTRAEVKRLAAMLEQSPKDFAESYLRTTEEGRAFASQPCPFLEGTRCSCYEVRPTVCRSYPHLDKRLMASRLLGVIGNASTCPIVYNVLEALKCELGHRWRQR